MENQNKPMSRSANFFCYFIAVICASACTPIKKPDNYYALNISCVDQSSPSEWEDAYMKMAEKYEGSAVQPSGKELDIIFKDMSDTFETLALKGNASGIGTYGLIQREKLIIDYTGADKKAGRSLDMPNYMKENMVRALSYIYVSANMQNPDNEFVRDAIAMIQRRKSEPEIFSKFAQYPITPVEWIKEAKANAESWKAHCGK